MFPQKPAAVTGAMLGAGKCKLERRAEKERVNKGSFREGQQERVNKGCFWW